MAQAKHPHSHMWLIGVPGLAVAALVAMSAAVAVRVSRPDLWPISFLLLVPAVVFQKPVLKAAS